MVVQTKLPEPVDVVVADRLRVTVDGDSEIGQATFAVGELGNLLMVDRHALTEGPVTGDLAELVRMIGMAIGAPVFTGYDGGDHLTLAGGEAAAAVRTQQRQQVGVEPFQIVLIQAEGPKPIGSQPFLALLVGEEAPDTGRV
jgi:hypothetical protein